MSAPSDQPDPTPAAPKKATTPAPAATPRASKTTTSKTTATPAAPTGTAEPVAPAEPARRRPWQRGPAGSGGGRGAVEAGIATFRTILAQVVWGICALFALILAVAALLIAIDANTSNELVDWLLARADNVDLGFFDLANPIKDWDEAETDPSQDVKTALFNYGIAAIVWLILGRVLDRIIRPGK